jgi:predicted ester cyclase
VIKRVPCADRALNLIKFGGVMITTGEERKALIRQVINEVVNNGNLASIDALFATNYIGHFSDGTVLRGSEGFKQFIIMLRGAFPDIQYNIENIACDGNLTAVRTSFTGTNNGSLRGIPPTGKKVTMQEALFYRWEGDKIVEEWQFINQLVMLQQFGIIPPSPTPGG